MISAKIVADSKNEFGNRITTMIVTFPRIILAEFNTHRMFSRNSASSRAIPFEKMVKTVQENPFIPIVWQKDHKGMQGSEYMDEGGAALAKIEWLNARDNSIKTAKELSGGNITKQLCNRLLEPFMWHTVIVTATEWENFFALRCPQYDLSEFYEGATNHKWRSKKDATLSIDKNATGDLDINWLKVNKGQAEIHMMALAEAMWDAYNESIPKELKDGEWHIPFEDKAKNLLSECSDMMSINQFQDALVKISTVMCARISYTTIDTEQSEWTYDKYIKKYHELVNANPIHASPLEHCARAMNEIEFHESGISEHISAERNNWIEGASGNFRGFIQLRKTIPNENITLTN